MHKNNFKALFNFSKKETNGIIILIIILIIAITSIKIIPEFLNHNQTRNYSKYKTEIETFKKSLKKSESNKNIADKNNFTHKEQHFNSFKKNKKQETKLINDSIQIKKYQDRKIKTPTKKIKLNTADTSILKSIPGIGSVFAGRIVKYRDLLGGYVDTRQLQEVYGLPADTYQAIKKYLIIDTNQINKININKVTFNELLKHPYINYYQTKAIFNYKKIKGHFLNINEIEQNNLLNEKKFKEIKPYLTTGQ